MNKFKQQNLRLRFSIIKATIFLIVFSISVFSQTIDVNKLAAEFEPEIRRAMIEGNIPSATVALISGDKVIWMVHTANRIFGRELPPRRIRFI